MTHMTQLSDADVVTVTEAAKALHVSRDTILRRADEGQFDGAYRSGPRGNWRIPVRAIAAFKAKNSPQRSQTSSSGEAAHGVPSGPVATDGDSPAEMPAGSLDSNPGQSAQEASNGHG